MTQSPSQGPTGRALPSGDSSALGATVSDGGCNFALFSAHAEAVELCLYAEDGGRETARHRLDARRGDIWHGFLPGVSPGTPYGYRVYGPYAPESGLRFNPNKLLLDPYARELRGDFRWHDSHFGYRRQHPEADLSFCDRDNAACMPKAVIGAPGAPRQSRRPDTPAAQSWLYELHLGGFTRLHPDIPEPLRGTCAGLAHPASLGYLRSLGITAVELLPVHAFIDEYALHRRGLRNYWGYNTLAFFAVHPAYSADAGPAGFRAMVDALHDAGLEVILDVVYNHSAESDELGPTLSLRGIDNQSYYRLDDAQPRYYVNDTGCGNTLDTGHPMVQRMILDSLRFWAGDMDVDGFRFDLAPVLGRGEAGDYRPDDSLLRAINGDPLLQRCKLIGEPWDLGPDGYQLGNMPAGWSEWNDRYRDNLRRFWRGDPGQLQELGHRLTGSEDLFRERDEGPAASVNYLCSHDGFTLRDLVSYREKHNAANGEDNRDGHADNASDNVGVEGPSDDPGIEQRRWRRQRNLLTTLALSQGLPMLQAGDEFGRTQSGNNNAYCQDNALTWVDWASVDSEGEDLRTFLRSLVALRSRSHLLRADRYRQASPDHDGQCIRWFGPDGLPASDAHWEDPARSDMLYAMLQCDSEGRIEDGILLLLNATGNELIYRLPEELPTPRVLLLNTAAPPPYEGNHVAGEYVKVAPESAQIALVGAGAVVHTENRSEAT